MNDKGVCKTALATPGLLTYFSVASEALGHWHQDTGRKGSGSALLCYHATATHTEHYSATLVLLIDNIHYTIHTQSYFCPITPI